ncbi:hypothetical protein SDC9_209844 [bioreactor metagenome]|uniref:Uncharacterized protein n=1 Tax=bioreactor metagenome TaxID=1076179 RepID=A0A645JEF8_9ZZZZ
MWCRWSRPSPAAASARWAPTSGWWPRPATPSVRPMPTTPASSISTRRRATPRARWSSAATWKSSVPSAPGAATAACSTTCPIGAPSWGWPCSTTRPTATARARPKRRATATSSPRATPWCGAPGSPTWRREPAARCSRCRWCPTAGA